MSATATSTVGMEAPHNLAAEEAVLGAVLLSSRALNPVIDTGLRPHHFYRERHAEIFAAMIRVHDRGSEPDPITLTDELRSVGKLDAVGGPEAIDALAGPVPAAGNARRYAKIVVEEHTWRTRVSAAYDIEAAVAMRDEASYIEAEERLAQPREDGRQRTFDPVELGLAACARLEAGAVETFPWPFKKLNDLTRGGMRRGQVTIVSGPTRHGKSVFLDQTLESAAAPGRRVALFINEMSAEERAFRVIARRANVDHEHLELAAAGLQPLDQRETGRATEAFNDMPFGMVECSGWTAADICREARRKRYDVIGIDIIQRLPHIHPTRVKDFEQASNEFDRFAKDTGCHVLITAHINRARGSLSPVVPIPTLGDIRDCAQLANDADNVVFVWRNQDDTTGEPEATGLISLAKSRGGLEGGLKVDFRGRYMTFIPALPSGAEV